MAGKKEFDELKELGQTIAKFASNMKLNPEPQPSRTGDEINEDEFGDYDEEYSTLNNDMDEIDEFMNSLEKKNDDLFAKLQEFLDENRQTLQAFQAEREGQDKDQTEEDGNHSETYNPLPV